jgi:hypothetical protein
MIVTQMSHLVKDQFGRSLVIAIMACRTLAQKFKLSVLPRSLISKTVTLMVFGLVVTQVLGGSGISELALV